MNSSELLLDLLKNRTATIRMLLIVLILLAAIIGPAYAPYNPLIPAPLDRLKGGETVSICLAQTAWDAIFSAASFTAAGFRS